MTLKSIRWKTTRAGLRKVVQRAAKHVLINHIFVDTKGHPYRWLNSEIEEFIISVEADVTLRRPQAGLDALPSFGNQLMVELAIYTISADRVLRGLGVPSDVSQQLVSDLGWDIYRRLLRLTSAPVRIVTRNPGRRIRWTIRMLLWFPFGAHGAPGYAVETRRDGDDILTHFTHCPPQTLARRLSEQESDPEILEVFRKSWCTFDWPGADLIADDGQRGHYRRTRTLSRGDSVCDMCWIGQTARQKLIGEPDWPSRGSKPHSVSQTN
ncbi:hypothetical protein [Octadecabacter sp. R77987]|uniref:hypothetical protein n=1 Tax=Octadecabacter sp. R77987 TaxID=3093874 RepID=UPI003672BF67